LILVGDLPLMLIHPVRARFQRIGQSLVKFQRGFRFLALLNCLAWSLFSCPRATTNINLLRRSDDLLQLRSCGSYRSLSQLFEGSLLLKGVGLRKTGGYFKLELPRISAVFESAIYSGETPSLGRNGDI
jgi:hypothetical protein